MVECFSFKPGPSFYYYCCLSSIHLKSAQELVHTCVRAFRIKLEFGSIGFSGEGKPENPEKNLSEQVGNQ